MGDDSVPWESYALSFPLTTYYKTVSIASVSPNCFEPSNSSSAFSNTLMQELIRVYHQQLPHLPRPKVKVLQDMWRLQRVRRNLVTHSTAQSPLHLSINVRNASRRKTLRHYSSTIVQIPCHYVTTEVSRSKTLTYSQSSRHIKTHTYDSRCQKSFCCLPLLQQDVQIYPNRVSSRNSIRINVEIYWSIQSKIDSAKLSALFR